MKKTLKLALIMVIAVCICACGSTGPKSEDTPAEGKPNVEHLGDGSPLTTEMTDGKLIAPDGEEVEFIGTMPNDESGRLRLAKTSSLIPTGDFAFDYYKNLFQGDEEIHAVMDPALGTTTSIKYESGLLLIDTYASVEGEEGDPALLFTGELLGSYVLDAETGAEAVYE